jgi:ATP-dependent protease ClpP protease subunit
MKWLAAALVSILILIPSKSNGDVTLVDDDTIMVHSAMTLNDSATFHLYIDDSQKHYKIIINSHGGSAFGVVSMLNHMAYMREQYGIKFTTKVSGMAFSAGAVLWLAGDQRVVHAEDILMFHGIQMIDPKTRKVIPLSELDAGSKLTIRVLDSKLERMLSKYIGKKKAQEWLKSEKYITGQEAYELGLANQLI